MPCGPPPIRADVVIPLIGVPGPCRSGRLDVSFGVVADTEQEQLHQLASKVLVGRRSPCSGCCRGSGSWPPVSTSSWRATGCCRDRRWRHRSICSRISTADPTLPRSLQKWLCQKNAMLLLERAGGVAGHLVEPEVSEFDAPLPVLSRGETDRRRDAVERRARCRPPRRSTRGRAAPPTRSLRSTNSVRRSRCRTFASLSAGLRHTEVTGIGPTRDSPDLSRFSE